MLAEEDILLVLKWAEVFHRREDKEMPKWVNDMVWDICVPWLTHWLLTHPDKRSSLRFLLQEQKEQEDDELEQKELEEELLRQAEEELGPPPPGRLVLLQGSGTKTGAYRPGTFMLEGKRGSQPPHHAEHDLGQKDEEQKEPPKSRQPLKPTPIPAGSCSWAYGPLPINLRRPGSSFPPRQKRIFVPTVQDLRALGKQPRKGPPPPPPPRPGRFG